MIVGSRRPEASGHPRAGSAYFLRGPALASRHSQRGIHWRANQKRDRDQHARQGRLARQHLRRAAVAQHQIRGGVSARLRQRQRPCASIGQYLTFYNGRRPHSSLDGKTPDQAYFTPLLLRMAANRGRRSTYRRGKTVQTTETTSDQDGAGSTDFGLVAHTASTHAIHKNRK